MTLILRIEYNILHEIIEIIYGHFKINIEIIYCVYLTF
jgi:hypothetical protein